MNKVKLTKEQAEAIKRITMKSVAVGIHIETGWKTGRNLCLNELTTDELIKALYIGYEVEPEIKVGDFVDIGLFGISKIAEVTGVKGDTIAINGSEEYQEFKINRVLTDEEKQEEKQRRWWAKHGRGINEIKIMDVLKDKRNGDVVEVEGKTKHNSLRVSTGDYINMTDVLYNYKIACFAEDRKDVDHVE